MMCYLRIPHVVEVFVYSPIFTIIGNFTTYGVGLDWSSVQSKYVCDHIRTKSAMQVTEKDLDREPYIQDLISTEYICTHIIDSMRGCKYFL